MRVALFVFCLMCVLGGWSGVFAAEAEKGAEALAGDAGEAVHKMTTDAEDNRATELLKKANSGMRAHEQGRYDEAFRLYTEVVDSGVLPPEDNLMSYIYNNRGLIRLRRAEYQAAVADFSNALKAHEESMIYVNRARARTLLGENDAALEDAEKALALNPESSRALNQRAIAYLNKGMPGRARQDIEKVRFMYPFLK